MKQMSNMDLMHKMRLFERKLRMGAARQGIGVTVPGMERPEPGFPGGGRPHSGMEGDQCRMGHMMGRMAAPHGAGEVPAFPGHHRRVPLSREHLLTIINKKPEGIHQKDIAKEANINQSSTSELINKLESDGYIERKVDPDDKRATLLFLTEKGKARAAEVEDERSEMFRDIFSVLTEEEKQTLSDLLDKLLRN